MVSSGAMQSMTFDKTLLLLGNAPITDALANWVSHWTGPVVCADGGARHLGALTASAIIGDMDSYTGTDGWTDTDQNSTDFEKCLARIDAPGIIGVGFLGGRWDHSLAALSALAKAPCPVTLIDHENAIRLVVNDYDGIHTTGEIVGVIPMEPCEFQSSHGLQYPLDGIRLALGDWVGSSNCVNDSKVSIRGRGRYWLTTASPVNGV